MITYKCKSCGGEMSISGNGDLVCAFCGNKSNFSDAELFGYKAFRREMLAYLASAAQNKADEAATKSLWSHSETIKFTTIDDDDVTINYLFKSECDGIPMYMGRDSIIFIFPPSRAADAKRMVSNVSLVKYPGADTKELSRCVPSINATLLLSDGSTLVVCAKHENMYPVEAFGSLEPAHSEWLLSRLENICCLLEYNSMIHAGISLEGICINPFTHEASLYGGWWKAHVAKERISPDLKDIRKVVLRTLGTNQGAAPGPFLDFLKSSPKGDAYEDFAAWDAVIEKKLGGHNFTKFKI